HPTADRANDHAAHRGHPDLQGSRELMRPGMAYNLLQYPRSVLELVPTRSTLVFVFRVRHAGVGTLQIGLGPRCYGAGPGPPAAGPPCPLANPKDPKGAGPAGMPIQAYTFTVKVYAQGAG